MAKLLSLLVAAAIWFLIKVHLDAQIPALQPLQAPTVPQQHIPKAVPVPDEERE